MYRRLRQISHIWCRLRPFTELYTGVHPRGIHIVHMVQQISPYITLYHVISMCTVYMVKFEMENHYHYQRLPSPNLGTHQLHCSHCDDDEDGVNTMRLYNVYDDDDMKFALGLISRLTLALRKTHLRRLYYNQEEQYIIYFFYFFAPQTVETELADMEGLLYNLQGISVQKRINKSIFDRIYASTQKEVYRNRKYFGQHPFWKQHNTCDVPSCT